MMNKELQKVVNLVYEKIGSFGGWEADIDRLRTFMILKFSLVCILVSFEFGIIFTLSENMVETVAAQFALGAFLVIILVVSVKLVPHNESRWFKIFATTTLVLFSIFVLGSIAINGFSDAGIFSNTITSNHASGYAYIRDFIFQLKDSLGPLGLILSYVLIVFGIHAYLHEAINDSSEYYKKKASITSIIKNKKELDFNIEIIDKNLSISDVNELKHEYHGMLLTILELLEGAVAARMEGITFSLPFTNKGSEYLEQIVEGTDSTEQLQDKCEKIKCAIKSLYV